MRTSARWMSAAGLVGLLVVLAAAPPAGAIGLPTVDLSSDPWFIGWSAALPPAYLGVDTGSSDVCVAGRLPCVDLVARRLERQLSGLGCDHNAIFSLAYARTTEKVAGVERADGAFFRDGRWLNHYDATFAALYFTRVERLATPRRGPARLADRLRRRRRPPGVGRREPPARDERARQPRPALRPVRDRARRAGRLVAQARPRPRQPDPQHGARAADRRDRGALRPLCPGRARWRLAPGRARVPAAPRLAGGGVAQRRAAGERAECRGPRGRRRGHRGVRRAEGRGPADVDRLRTPGHHC